MNLLGDVPVEDVNAALERRAAEPRRRAQRRCTCGRFARFDAYYGRWYCDRCEREVK